MQKTKLQAEGMAVVVDGVTKYRMDWFCLAAGELPDTKIFLYAARDITNSATDEFIRVVYPGDFDNYPADRAQAFANAKNYYRSAYLSRLYDDVQLAATAKRALDDYINKLVTDYITYKNDVAQPPHEVEYPSVSPDLVTELKTAYLNAYNDLLSANNDYALAQNDFATAKTAYTTAATHYTTWSSLAANANVHKNTLVNFVTLIDTNIGKITDKPGFEGTVASIASALSGANGAATALHTVVGDISTQATQARVDCETAAARVSSLRQTVYEKYATALYKWNVASAALNAVQQYDPVWTEAQQELLNAAKPSEPVFD